jgi:cytochrome c biogenesis protein CcdA
VLAAGTLYTIGRAVSYTALTAVLVWVGLEVSHVSWFLQDIGQYVLGPVLVLVGLVVLGIIPLRLPSALGNHVRLGERLAESGPLGAFGLGALFALAFCPYSAALFFGVMLPLAFNSADGIALAPAFAVGTSLPVLVLAVVVSAGVARFLGLIQATSKVEIWLRRGAGVVFILAGLYLAISTIWVA